MLVKVIAQANAPARDPRAHRAQGCVRCDGDLLVREPLDIAENDGDALIQGQRLQPTRDYILQFVRQQAFLRVDLIARGYQAAENTGGVWLILVSEAIKRFLDVPMGAPPVIAGLVGGDAQEPGAKRGAGTK